MRLSLPLQLGGIILFALIAGSFLPDFFLQASYTFSLGFKEILGSFLPFIVFSFVVAGILSFEKNAPMMLMLLLGGVLCSNAIVAAVAYNLGRILVPFLTKNFDLTGCIATERIVPFFTFSLPTPIASEQALFAALGVGVLFSLVRIPALDRAFFQLKSIVEYVLNKVFIPLLPLYVLGFLLEVQHAGTFSALFRSYGSTFICIIAIHWLYLAALYFIASGFSRAQAGAYLKNVAPSYLTAFSTLSSTATIPVTIQSALKNKVSRGLANVAAPIMANVHLVGDGISTPLLALVTMQVFQGNLPDVITFATFIGYFCLTMLATSGVPGGGIIVMIPILKSQLGFSPEMVSIITTLYLLQDAFGTAGNVTGDGALMIMLQKAMERVGLVKVAQDS